MRGNVGFGLWLVVTASTAALGQNPSWQHSAYDRPGAQQPPVQPSQAQPSQEPTPQQWPQPVVPVLQRRGESAPPPTGGYPQQPGVVTQGPMSQQPGTGAHAQQAPAPPFFLTPEQQAEVDRILTAWEKHTSGVRTFDCKFVRFQYDEVFGKAGQPMFEEKGEIKYASPDKATFRVLSERPEHWICDGKSIFVYNYQKKQISEYRLPPELQGSAIADGPIPFLFGAKAESLKKRYFLRVIPEYSRAGEVWIQAFPRRQQDAANFHHAEVILATEKMLPSAIQLHDPNNGKSRTVYKFDSPRINPIDPFKHLDPLKLFGSDPFRPELPGRDWIRVVEDPPSQAAQRQPPPAGWK